MTEIRDPMAPFVFHDTEAFVGEGALLRTHRRRLVTLIVLILLVLGVVAAIQVPQWMWRGSLDATVNERTGLPDGEFVLEPQGSMHEGDACWFRGAIRGHPEAGDVTVAGTGAVQCAGASDYVARVLISVQDGRARITRAAGY